MTEQGVLSWMSAWESLNQEKEMKSEYKNIPALVESTNPEPMDTLMFNEAVTIMASMIQIKLKELNV